MTNLNTIAMDGHAKKKASYGKMFYLMDESKNNLQTRIRKSSIIISNKRRMETPNGYVFD